MSQTLLTIDTESIVTSACFRPNHLMILYGTQVGDLILREILPPEDEPSSFNSEDFDLDNKLQLHTVIIYHCNFSSAAIRYSSFISENEFFVCSNTNSAIFMIENNSFKSRFDINITGITAFQQLNFDNDSFNLVQKELSKNLKIAALQRELIQPFKRANFPPAPQTLHDNYYFAFGTDNGELIIQNINTNTTICKFHDAADFISSIKQLKDLIVVSSGDGTVYLYKSQLKNSFSSRLEENSLPEDYDLNCLETIFNFTIVGTSEGEILKYDITELSLPIQKLQTQFQSIETICKLPGGIMLFGCENGSVQILSIRPFQILGTLCENENNPVLIIEPSQDYSLLAIGGASNKLFIQDMQWFAEDIGIKQIDVEEKFETEETAHEGEQTEQHENNENINKTVQDQSTKSVEESDESESSDDVDIDEAGDVKEVSRGGISEIKSGGQFLKIIQPGHIDSDSSFSDFFAPVNITKKISQKDKMKKQALSKSKKIAQRQAFFKDIDSASD
ncbi:WD40 repeat protein [Spironucleus salmonicida]|uniref:WD40 repeat protein n=1 Tax=Spironucleus salmonicida TaxID=348837 RepID=V6LNI9_9EUKA|nr:WD40 repeat protein [Spironucleus salmonicida]|eukprot:EST46237.1 hypothetical protein SS50377_13833 [Spironucleus salmonicida]